jgi:glucose/arabinose dehydrogenase
VAQLGAIALVVTAAGLLSPTAAGAAPASTTVKVSVPAPNRSAPFDQARSLRVPAGRTVQVWARVPSARFALWTPQHDLLVSVPTTGKVIELVPGANPATVPTTRVLLSGLNQPQGLAFDTLGGKEVLYVAETDRLDRYAWGSSGTVGARTVLASGLPSGNADGSPAHTLKEVVVGADHTVYVDIGSSSNVNTVDPTAKPPRAVVMAYRPSGKGSVFATGIRNGDGLSFDPDGHLWTAVNERDAIAYPFQRTTGPYAHSFGQVIASYVNDHPPDELAKLTEGRNLGWPYCDPDPDVTPGSATSALQYANLPFDRDAQTNPRGTRLNCSKLAPIERGIPGHSAPLGFHFLEGSPLPTPWSNGAVVVVHGSWDRTPPRAPAVLWFPWDAGAHTLGNQVNLVTGFQAADGTRWGRPADAVPGPDGALYVTDDMAGAVYRIVPTAS